MIMKRSLRYTIHFLAFAFFSLQAAAQSGPYGNEWVDYSKTYYKFKVGKAGVYRIQRAALDAAGLPSTVNGSNFMLFRDGQEIPVYVSANTMTGSDYIEFIGKGATGVLDKELYADTTWQPNNRISLYTDTAAYFLTYDNNTNHLRFTEQANTIPGTPPAPEAYNWAITGNYYKDVQTQGPSYDSTYNPTGSSPNPGNPFFSPSYENGEGMVNAQTSIFTTSNIVLATPNIASVAVNAILQTAVTTRSYRYSHAMNIAVNGGQVANGSWGISETKHFSPSFPAGQLSANNTITYTPVNAQGTAYDIYGVAYAELKYPRNYDVSGLTYHSFQLSANSNPQYLVFTGFGNACRLYDITNRKFYAGDVQGTNARFYLQPSLTDRDLVLVATAGGTSNVAVDKTVRFTNYLSAANQGDYIIITHNKLMQPVSGRSYIDEYKTYRASASGGLHTVQVADVTELYDQFAYGYDTHPMSIAHFLKHAYDKWTNRPVYVNIIGHGLEYQERKEYYSEPSVFTFPIVPVYGSPGSDVNYVNFGNPRIQKMQIGRVSVWNAAEIGQYLNKVIVYEAALKAGTDASALWKKQIMHIAGGNTPNERDGLLSTLNRGADIISDTLLGGRVTTFSKGSTSPVDVISLQSVIRLLTSGLNMITYFGHASSSEFSYNLPLPSTYSNSPRFPVFMALGCDVAQMFTASPGKTISENYTLSPASGSIAMLATDNYGYTDFLDNYLDKYYKSVAYRNFGGTVGLHFMETNNQMVTAYQGFNNWRYYFTQVESQILTGDPALPTFGPANADYVVTNDGISAIPTNVTTAIDSFQLRVTSNNIGRAIHDTVQVKVEHTNPAGVKTTVRTYNIADLFNTDTTFIWVPINKITDLGLNKYTVTIDPSDKFDELNELNNTGNLDLFIYSDNIVPVYPYEFGIVNKQGVTLKASTLNIFRPSGRYLMEIDTTALFNSPAKLQTAIVSRGGLIKWTPSLVMKDSTVYYWRATVDSTTGGNLLWSSSSFIYLAHGTPGWNQSHFYQYKRDGFNQIVLDSNRIFRYANQQNSLTIYNKVLQSDDDVINVSAFWNGGRIQGGPNDNKIAVQIMVIDSLTGQFWINTANDTRGAYPPQVTRARGVYMREFRADSRAIRDSAAKYIESVPPGNFIAIKNNFWDYRNLNPPGILSPSIFINDWKADTPRVTGNTLYQAIRDLGFTYIDSFTREGAFLFSVYKGNLSTVSQQWTADSSDTLYHNTIITSLATNGTVNSTVAGPVRANDTLNLQWRIHANDTHPENDSAYVHVYGINAANTESFLFRTMSKDTTFPAAGNVRIRMEWKTRDSLTVTPPQLDFWRLMYKPLPEAALNPAAYYAFSDTLQAGQLQTFGVAVENLTELPMDSMLVNYKVINANSITSSLPAIRYRPLPGLDTLHATITFDPSVYPGNNNLFIEANPGNDQPEQYHPNNLGYVPFTISVDQTNPLLDVTFDGIHILNRDIVSAKPLIKISLKDENKYLALNDTSLVTLVLKGQHTGTIPLRFDGATCKFVPGMTGTNGKNEAVIEIRKDLEDDIYTLIVEGKDRSGNEAGTPQGSAPAAKYRIEFEVINKATVSNVLNYPNPFSTATSFLFTITGSQIPSQFKIQILSVTGKVVREITKDELGPLHIGRNMTEYKWDGRDQYGQLLGNGVYMYRVATSLNGAGIEHRASGADRFFKNGYGKLYIMR